MAENDDPNGITIRIVLLRYYFISPGVGKFTGLRQQSGDAHKIQTPFQKSWETVQIVNKKECNHLQIS